MLQIAFDKTLREENTFKVDVASKYHVEVASADDVVELCHNPLFLNSNHLIVGSAANILFTHNFDGMIIKSKIEDVTVMSETDDFVEVKVGSGVNWNGFVEYTLQHRWYGVENLIGIPGLCGGCVVQNIGAYGMEIADSVVAVEAVDLIDSRHDKVTFLKESCEFEYRNSVFKNTDNLNRYFITHIVFKLGKTYTAKTNYVSLKAALSEAGNMYPSVNDVVDMIKTIRAERLPDLNHIGCAGSFFKNPIVEYEKHRDTIERHNLIYHPVKASATLCKLSAGQLIDLSGLKGFRLGQAGIYNRNALIMCNYGGATGEEIYRLSLYVVEKVKAKFGIGLVPEVVIW